jgi:HEAT repeat protein
MLDDAFEALKTYDWGTDRAPVAPIEAAVAAAHGKPADREDLEKRLLAALQGDISRDAKGFVCRMLTIVGGVASVPILAALLADDYLSHMARYALERIQAPEAGQALLDSLPRLSSKLKIGIVSSLGSRGEASAVTALSGLVMNDDASVARAAARALGEIGNVEAAKALEASSTSADETKRAVIDARLACAERLLASNKNAVALGIYKSLAGDGQARLVRLAATRGMLSCAAKTA